MHDNLDRALPISTSNLVATSGPVGFFSMHHRERTRDLCQLAAISYSQFLRHVATGFFSVQALLTFYSSHPDDWYFSPTDTGDPNRVEVRYDGNGVIQFRVQKQGTIVCCSITEWVAFGDEVRSKLFDPITLAQKAKKAA